MNKAYKVVYSKARQKFVVASELALSGFRGALSSKSLVVRPLMAALLAIFADQSCFAETVVDEIGMLVNIGDQSAFNFSITPAFAIGQGSIAKTGEVSFGANQASEYVGKVLFSGKDFARAAKKEDTTNA